MVGFSTLAALTKLTGQFPDAQDILYASKEGGDRAQIAIARQWLSEGIPYAFQNSPWLYEIVRNWIAVRLDIEAKSVNLTGSGRLGQSLAPKQLGKPFNGSSDLDFFVVSGHLFNLLKFDYLAWCDDFDLGNIKPSNPRQERFWNDTRKRTEKYIGRGLLDANLLPNLTKYSAVQKVNQTMYILTKKLASTAGAPDIKHASIRCYKNWQAFERQSQRNLQSIHTHGYLNEL